MLAGVANDISQQVLRTDVAGMPLEWIDYREAVRLYHAEQVAYDCGTRLYTVFGGYSSLDGSRSRIDVNSIIATCVAGRLRQLEQRRYSMSALQQLQGRAHAGAGRDAAHSGAVYAQLR